MKTPEGAAPLEPSIEAIVTVRQRLHQMGFLLSEEAARELLRDVFAVESPRMDRRAREAATACLRGIQDAALEAMRILTQGAPATPKSAPVQQPVAPARTRDEAVDLAEVVRRRLGDDLSAEPSPRRPDEPAAAPSQAGPPRPVFKGRRGR